MLTPGADWDKNRKTGKQTCSGMTGADSVKELRMNPTSPLMRWICCIWMAAALLLTGCGAKSVPESFHDPDIDFSALRSIAVMPLANLSRDQQAADRVRDTFINSLMSTGALYVVPPGEVARGIARAGITNPSSPSKDDVTKIAAIVQADALITGVVREYGEVRSGATSANVVSVGLQMFESSTQRVVWTASATRGGISMADRLLGGGGRPMNDVTQAAVNDLINKLLY